MSRNKISFMIACSMLIAVLLLNFVFSEDLETLRLQRLKYGLSLYLSNIQSTPAEIAPGAEAALKFHLENVANNSLRDVIIELDLPGEFAPKDTIQKKIRTLAGIESIDITFQVIALPNSAEGIYKIPITISYIDEIGNTYNENNTISLVIAAEPKIFVGFSSSDIYAEDTSGKVSIRIANTGVGNVKFLVAELPQSAEYEIVGPNKVYVGAIDSDDYETIDFKITAKQGARTITLPLHLTYSNANNKEYEKIVEVPVTIITQQEAGIQKQQNNSWMIIAVILVIGYLIYRHIRKRRKKQ